MCGIVGFQGNIGNISEIDKVIKLMMNSIRYRGPDSCGNWVDPEHEIVMAHQRLSIIDLSKSGHQPMTSKNERYVISFNGEVYNYRSLRKELEVLGIKFSSLSDTEVLLESFAY